MSAVWTELSGVQDTLARVSDRENIHMQVQACCDSILLLEQAFRIKLRHLVGLNESIARYNVVGITEYNHHWTELSNLAAAYRRLLEIAKCIWERLKRLKDRVTPQTNSFLHEIFVEIVKAENRLLNLYREVLQKSIFVQKQAPIFPNFLQEGNAFDAQVFLLAPTVSDPQKIFVMYVAGATEGDGPVEKFRKGQINFETLKTNMKNMESSRKYANCQPCDRGEGHIAKFDGLRLRSTAFANNEPEYRLAFHTTLKNLDGTECIVVGFSMPFFVGKKPLLLETYTRIFWHFGNLGEAAVDRNHLVAAVKHFFQEFTGCQRGLTDADLHHFLEHRGFNQPSVRLQPRVFGNHLGFFYSCHKDSNVFGPFEWLFEMMVMIRKYFRTPWNKHVIAGLMSSSAAEELVAKQPQPTIMFRFADSYLGCLCLLYPSVNNGYRVGTFPFYKENFESMFTRRSLPRIIRESILPERFCNEIQLIFPDVNFRAYIQEPTYDETPRECFSPVSPVPPTAGRYAKDANPCISLVNFSTEMYGPQPQSVQNRLLPPGTPGLPVQPRPLSSYENVGSLPTVTSPTNVQQQQNTFANQGIACSLPQDWMREAYDNTYENQRMDTAMDNPLYVEGSDLRPMEEATQEALCEYTPALVGKSIHEIESYLKS